MRTQRIDPLVPPLPLHVPFPTLRHLSHNSCNRSWYICRQHVQLPTERVVSLHFSKHAKHKDIWREFSSTTGEIDFRTARE